MLANMFLIIVSVALFVVAAPVVVPSRGALVTSAQVMKVAKDFRNTNPNDVCR